MEKGLSVYSGNSQVKMCREKVFIEKYGAVVKGYYCRTVKSELRSAYLKILLAVNRRFTIVRISDNGPGWK